MRIVLDQAAVGQSPIPKLRVEFRNGGEKDLLLNLGIMTRHGAEQYPTAVSLIVVDAQGDEKWLELKRPHQDSKIEPFFMPLPAGATFSFGVDLDDYWTPTSEEDDYTLKPGTYLLAAHLARFGETNPQFVARFALQTGDGRPFDVVNPQVGLGPYPISNIMRLQVPRR